jgi:hypothetical protein
MAAQLPCSSSSWCETMAESENHGGPTGAPPKMELHAAYRELLVNLYYANEVYKDKGDSGREGIRIACQALTQFIMVRLENPELAAPLLALRSALIDLEKGISNPILDPRATIGKQSRSSIKKQISLIAAACLDALVAEGDALKAAASGVARHVNRWRGIGDHSVTSKTIMNWRENYRSLPEQDRKPFDNIRKHLSECPDRRAQVEQLLREGPPGIPKT